jgi:hypothetical protein
MKMIATLAVATALLGLAACSTEDTAPATDVVAAEEAAPVTDAAPEAENTGGPCGDGRELGENEVCP